MIAEVKIRNETRQGSEKTHNEALKDKTRQDDARRNRGHTATRLKKKRRCNSHRTSPNLNG